MGNGGKLKDRKAFLNLFVCTVHVVRSIYVALPAAPFPSLQSCHSPNTNVFLKPLFAKSC